MDKPQYDILGFCSENYKDCFDFSIKSWLSTNARKIYIYTDGWTDDTQDDRIKFIDITEKDSNWINNVGKKLDCIIDYWDREDSIDNFCFLDVDNYITSDISEIFEINKTIALTRIDLPHKTVSAGNVFFNKNKISKKFLFDWKKLQDKHKIEKSWDKNHWGVAYDQTSLHELTWADIKGNNEYKITSLDSKIYNCEHNSNHFWVEKIKESKSKILHFKAKKWQDEKLVQEIKKIIENFKSKNVVFMMDVDLDGEGRYSSERRLPYKYSIDSWKKWCDKNDCDLFVLNDLIVDKEEMSVCWQRYYLFEILDANDINYDQILMVDSDTIVHPNCPNFFDITEHKYVGVHNEGSYDWILRSIENYSKYIFNNKSIDWWKYINGGFQIVNKKHKEFFQDIISFYYSNKDNLIKLQNTFHTGTDQTPINFLLQNKNIELKILPYEFNMCDMMRKEILNNELTMTKIGWVYHYNCIPKEFGSPLGWMKKTYDHLYGSLTNKT
tara:strand:+ start:1493 stop:2983 length:1491 start_codon:yes stop_codon:yes gene_type:complete